MTMKRFFAMACVAIFSLAIFALAGCSNPSESETATPSLLSIRAETVKTDYILGEKLNLGAITVTGTYSGGNTRILSISAADITGYEPETPGPQTLRVVAEGKSDTFTVTVTSDPAVAREILDAAVDKTLDNIQGIVLSGDGKDVPQGINWITPAQKATLDRAVDAALALTASGSADMGAIVSALETLQAAADAAMAAAEAQAGSMAEWSYTVAFNNNGGDGENPQPINVASPKTSVGSLPLAPARSGYAFGGWNTRADGAGSGFAGTTPVTGSLTVHAVWIDVVNARSPQIRTQPRSAVYAAGEAAAALAVAATSPDGGELSYQWYRSVDGAAGSGWTAISGATESLYTPPTTAGGAVAYYARVANTNDRAGGIKTASTNSNIATITVTVVNASSPVISGQIQDAAYVVGEAAAALSVTASSPDGGVLSYQWHSAAADSDGWTAIENGTGSSYTPQTAVAGILSYYVRVANTNEGASGATGAWTNSAVATITVRTVDAGAPDITGQPQGGTYALNEAATLSVAATSPDSGVLSYQWHRSTDAGEWTAISGATGASYAPPTGSYGTVSYYARVSNTNSSASGAKTTTVNSSPAALTVARVNAQAPLVKIQPQDAAYYPNDPPAALSVVAEVSDGGALSYQWHSRGAGATGWTKLNGQTGSSYLPPTGSLGIVYYYVAVTNTKTGLDGEPSAVSNSKVAKIDVTTSGASGLRFDAWVNDDGGLMSDMPEDLVIALGESLTIVAADDLTDLQWSVNNTNIAGPRGAAQTIVIEAAGYAAGKYTLGLHAKKGGIPYSISVSFMVDK
jgi:quinol monooxygenase YgiN